MKNLSTLLILLLPIIGNGQKLIEVSHNFEDKATGINLIDLDNHFAIGAESGEFNYTNVKIEHQKFKAGYSFMIAKNLIGGSGMITTVSPCYNMYNTIYNDGTMTRTPKISIELSFRINFTHRISYGAQIDIINRTGGLNIGFLIFK